MKTMRLRTISSNPPEHFLGGVSIPMTEASLYDYSALSFDWRKDNTTPLPHADTYPRCAQKKTGGRSRPFHLEATSPTRLSSPPPQTAPAPPFPSPALSQAPPRGEALPPAADGGGTRAVPGEPTVGLFPRAGRAGPAVVGVRPSPARCARALSQRERVEIRADRWPGSVARCLGSVAHCPGSVARSPGSVVHSPGSVARDAGFPDYTAGSAVVVPAAPAVRVWRCGSPSLLRSPG